jgi:hypothetical protein
VLAGAELGVLAGAELGVLAGAELGVLAGAELGAAEETDDAADTTGATADETGLAAEETGGAPADAEVAASAWRENTSKMVRIPAAKIATCTARCAMRRKIDCGMSNSAPPGRDQTFARVPAINGLKHPRAPKFSGLSRHSLQSRTHCSVTTVQHHHPTPQGELPMTHRELHRPRGQ